MVVIATALSIVGLVLVLGHWRVQMQKNSHEQQIRAAWAVLRLSEKRRLFASAEFIDGLDAAGPRFSRTRQAMQSTLERIDGPALDRLFETYLAELRRSDYWASAQEWRQTLERVQRWLSPRPQ